MCGVKRVKIISLLLGITIATSTFGLEISSKFDKLQAERIESVLIDADKWTGTSPTPLHQKMFNQKGESFEGTTYTSFFRSRISLIDLSETPAVFKTPEAIKDGLMLSAYVIPMGLMDIFGRITPIRPTSMYLTTEFMNANVSTYHFFSTLLHESKHADFQGRFAHVDCPVGSKKLMLPYGKIEGAKAACDNGVDGAYGLQAIMAMNIMMRCQNCTAKIKQDAMFAFAAARDRIVNMESQIELAADSKSGLELPKEFLDGPLFTPQDQLKAPATPTPPNSAEPVK